MEAKKTDTSSQEIKISRKMFVGTIIGAVVILAVILGLIFFSPFESGSSSTSDGEVVAKVNGQAIYQGDVDKLKTSLQTQSPLPLEDSAVIEQLVVQNILLQQAEDEDITITTQEAEDEVSKVLSKNGRTLEDFKVQLTASKLNYETVLEDFKKQLQIQKLIEAHVEIRDVTDAEALAYYESNKAVLFQGAVPPAYETVKEQLKEYIKQQNSQPKLLEYVQSLKQTADIELL